MSKRERDQRLKQVCTVYTKAKRRAKEDPLNVLQHVTGLGRQVYFAKLGSPLQAALDDPRWLAQEGLKMFGK